MPEASLHLAEELKKMSEYARVIIRTGETSPFANIVLVAGVNF